jgi:acylphosphatase
VKKSYAITVSGKVQNVGFRYYTVQAAMQFGVNGFVKNQYDGTVYIEAEGEQDAMEAFLAWCRRGPQWVRVEGFNVQEQPVMGYKGFTVR